MTRHFDRKWRGRKRVGELYDLLSPRIFAIDTGEPSLLVIHGHIVRIIEPGSAERGNNRFFFPFFFFFPPTLRGRGEEKIKYG